MDVLAFSIKGLCLDYFHCLAYFDFFSFSIILTKFICIVGCNSWFFRFFCLSLKKTLMINKFFMEFIKRYLVFMSMYNNNNFFKIISKAIKYMEYKILTLEKSINKGKFIGKALDSLHIISHTFGILNDLR
ncbi:hypothetical protein WN944_025521 [Citrus x changshan-huyou]|uniref:Uncharacterized protein n=1 Tax=Citrus x changshan-huyou TaxID=2935761 RepID=A0AAP0QGR4_9ROSI